MYDPTVCSKIHIDKRKAVVDKMELEPSPKKVEIDGQNSVATSNSPLSQLHEATGTIANSSVDSNAGQSSSSLQAPKETTSQSTGSRRKVVGADRYIKTPTVLAQIWKEEMNSGKLLTSLYELFGESILSYIPAPELSTFLWQSVFLYLWL